MHATINHVKNDTIKELKIWIYLTASLQAIRAKPLKKIMIF